MKKIHEIILEKFRKGKTMSNTTTRSFNLNDITCKKGW